VSEVVVAGAVSEAQEGAAGGGWGAVHLIMTVCRLLHIASYSLVFINHFLRFRSAKLRICAY
jgi:hypothetical protein